MNPKLIIAAREIKDYAIMNNKTIWTSAYIVLPKHGYSKTDFDVIEILKIAKMSYAEMKRLVYKKERSKK